MSAVADRWLRENRHKLTYDPTGLPDVGDLVDGREVIMVDRREGWYEIAAESGGLGGTRVVLPRTKP